MIVKEKELIKLRKKVLQTENEESKKSKVIHNKLASLLSKTDKRNPENKKTELNRNRDHEIKQLQKEILYTIKIILFIFLYSGIF